MIIDYVEESLGKKGQILQKTRVNVACDCCGKTWQTSQEHRKKRERDYCSSCRNKLGISGMLGKHRKPKES